MDDPFDDFIKLHGWAECGSGRLQVEDLYQMFKRRLMEELNLSETSSEPQTAEHK